MSDPNAIVQKPPLPVVQISASDRRKALEDMKFVLVRQLAYKTYIDPATNKELMKYAQTLEDRDLTFLTVLRFEVQMGQELPTRFATSMMVNGQECLIIVTPDGTEMLGRNTVEAAPAVSSNPTMGVQMSANQQPPAFQPSAFAPPPAFPPPPVQVPQPVAPPMMAMPTPQPMSPPPPVASPMQAISAPTGAPMQQIQPTEPPPTGRKRKGSGVAPPPPQVQGTPVVQAAPPMSFPAMAPPMPFGATGPGLPMPLPSAPPAFAPAPLAAPAPVAPNAPPQVQSASVDLSPVLKALAGIQDTVDTLNKKVQGVQAQNEQLKEKLAASEGRENAIIQALHHIYMTNPQCAPLTEGKVTNYKEFQAFLQRYIAQVP